MIGRDEIRRYGAAFEMALVKLNSGAKLAYSIDEAILATSIGRTSLYEDINSGKLKARKRGRSTIILTEDLSEYLRALPSYSSE